MISTTRTRLLASTLFAGTALVAMPANAQSAATNPADTSGPVVQDGAEPAATESGEVVVTGTLIRNPNLVASSPVSVTTSEEIDLKQAVSAERLLRDIPGISANIGSNVNNGNNGTSLVDLRGLGSNRNIVLLDGTRITPADVSGAIDLNSVPLALIERVDVLTGGASTTYGADAVSGVVNFITKRNFSGAALTSTYGITERGDGARLRIDATVGADLDGGRGNAVLSIGYQKADPIFFAGQRPRSIDTVDSFDGTGAGGSGTGVPARFSTGIGSLSIDPATGALVPLIASFNFNPYNIFQTPYKRFNIYGAARYEVVDGIEVYTQALFSKNTVNTVIAPSGAFGTPVSIALNNPFLPAPARAQFCAYNDFDPNTPGVQAPTGPCSATSTERFTTTVNRRLVESGGRISDYTTQIFNYRLGARGNITDRFSFDIYGAYGESVNTQTQLNYISATRLRNALNTVNATTCANSDGGCVPVNLFGPAGSITTEMVRYLIVPAFSSNKTSLAQVHGVVNGDLFTLSSSSRPAAIAIGGEFRNYWADIGADALALNPGELGGTGGGIIPVSGGYRVYEGFGELIVPLASDAPLMHNLTVEAGLRYSGYKVDAPGNPSFKATTWKAGGTWEPTEGLKFRGNYQRAVRAPNIGELFQPSQVGLSNLQADPCQGTAPVGNALLRAVCIAQGAPASAIGLIGPPSAGQINATFAGNLNNRPEQASTYTLGIVFQPRFVPRLSVSIDYYNIKIKRALSAPGVDDVIGACFTNLTAASATDPACTTIRRNPATGGLDGDPSTTPGIPSPLTNTGRFATDGIDFAANWRADLGEKVSLSLSANANYVFSYKFQARPGGTNRECVGYFSVNCLPGWRLAAGSGGSLLPEFNLNQRTTLTVEGIDLSLLWRHISPMRQEPLDAIAGRFGSNGPAFAPFRRVKAYDWFDVSTRFSIGSNMQMTLMVENLFDTAPPTVGSNIGDTTFNSGNTYPSTYDALGRRYTAGVRLKF